MYNTVYKFKGCPARTRIACRISAVFCAAIVVATLSPLSFSQNAPPTLPSTRPSAPEAPAPGLQLFEQRCSACHGSNNAGQRAPDLNALMKLSPQEILNALTTGVMSTQAQGLSDAEKHSIAESIGSWQSPGANERGAVSMPNRCSSNPPLVAPSAGPSWNGWGVDAANTRFQSSEAAGISAGQVPQLKLKWAFAFRDGIPFSQPTVVSGRVFIGSNNGDVYALQASSGCLYWSFHAASGVHTAISIGKFKRHGNPAYAAYFGDMKANVYAVDAATGRLLWKTLADDHPLAHITGAPTLSGGSLYVPVSSSEEGISSRMEYACCNFRGSVVSLDAATGRRRWKTYTIPQSPAPTRKNSLGTQLWAPAGAAVWSSPTVDPKRGALYVGTGNAYTEPAAANSDSIMALDRRTGRVLWSFQSLQNDTWIRACDSSASENCPRNLGPDHDFGSSPILRKLPDGRRVIIAASKSGAVVALDPDHRGAVLWKTNLAELPPSAEGLIVFGGAADQKNAYFPLATGGAAAVQLATGSRLWTAHFDVPPPDAAGNPQPYGQTAAASAIPGILFSGGWDGILRALSTAYGAVVWEYNTVATFETVNAVPGRGGSMGSPGPTIAGGMLFVGSGYRSNPGPGAAHAGNVLLAFAPE